MKFALQAILNSEEVALQSELAKKCHQKLVERIRITIRVNLFKVSHRKISLVN